RAAFRGPPQRGELHAAGDSGLRRSDLHRPGFGDHLRGRAGHRRMALPAAQGADRDRGHHPARGRRADDLSEFLQQLDPVSLLSITLITATPLTLAALGGLTCERSGVVNIALEGVMLTGAFIGYAVAFFTHNLWIGVAAAVLSRMLIASLHAVLSISLLVDQIVSGMVINIMAVGITGVFYRTYLESATSAGPGTLPHCNVPVLPYLPVIGPIFFENQFVTYAMLVLIVVVHFILFRTVWGLRTRACGENPRAAETAGINVYFVRYVNVIASGALAGLGGAYFSLQQIGNFLPNMTGRLGYLGLAR